MVVVEVLAKVCGLARHEDCEVVQDLGLGEPLVLVSVRLPDQVLSLRLVGVKVLGVDPEHQLILVDDPILVEVSECPELETCAVPLLDILGLPVQMVDKLRQSQLAIPILNRQTKLHSENKTKCFGSGHLMK